MRFYVLLVQLNRQKLSFRVKDRNYLIHNIYILSKEGTNLMDHRKGERERARESERERHINRSDWVCRKLGRM